MGSPPPRRVWLGLLVAALLLIAAGAFLLYSPRVQAQQVTRTPVEAVLPVAPIPIRALGRTHLVYEIHLTNFGAMPLTVAGLATLDAARPDAPLDTDGAAEVARTAVRIGEAPAGRATAVELQPGKRVVLFRWATLPPGAPTPERLVHRVALAPIGPGAAAPDTLTLRSAPVSADTPSVVRAPVGAGRWVAVRGPSATSGHRIGVVALHGRVGAPQRFAVDWAKLGDDGRLFSGDPRRNESWHGYGAEVRAMAAGTVASTIDGVSEHAPLSAGAPAYVPADSAAGNAVVVRHASGEHAVYAHLQPGSLRVRQGERVAAGQLLGRIGNSGNSLAPHLHVHLSDAPATLEGEGRPFALASFTLLGRVEALGAVLRGEAWVAASDRPARTVQGETPLENMVVEF